MKPLIFIFLALFFCVHLVYGFNRAMLPPMRIRNWPEDVLQIGKELFIEKALYSKELTRANQTTKEVKNVIKEYIGGNRILYLFNLVLEDDEGQIREVTVKVAVDQERNIELYSFKVLR